MPIKALSPTLTPINMNTMSLAQHVIFNKQVMVKSNYHIPPFFFFINIKINIEIVSSVSPVHCNKDISWEKVHKNGLFLICL